MAYASLIDFPSRLVNFFGAAHKCVYRNGFGEHDELLLLRRKKASAVLAN